MYAAQEIPQIDPEIAQKGHFRMETNYHLELDKYTHYVYEVISKVIKREKLVIPTEVGIQFFLYVAKFSGFPFSRE